MKRLSVEVPKLPEALDSGKRALEGFGNLPYDEDVINGLINLDTDWLATMEINAFRHVSLLQHLRLNFDESITRMRKL